MSIMSRGQITPQKHCHEIKWVYHHCWVYKSNQTHNPNQISRKQPNQSIKWNQMPPPGQATTTPGQSCPKPRFTSSFFRLAFLSLSEWQSRKASFFLGAAQGSKTHKWVTPMLKKFSYCKTEVRLSCVVPFSRMLDSGKSVWPIKTCLAKVNQSMQVSD